MNDCSRPGYKPQLAIREFVLLLLTDRNYPVWQRLYLLGLFAQRLQTLTSGVGVTAWSEANPAAVAQLLADRAQVAIEFRLRSMMNEIESRPADRLQFVVELLRLRVSEPPVAARFLECISGLRAGTRLREGEKRRRGP